MKLQLLLLGLYEFYVFQQLANCQYKLRYLGVDLTIILEKRAAK
jgi:hypothetical protein